MINTSASLSKNVCLNSRITADKSDDYILFMWHYVPGVRNCGYVWNESFWFLLCSAWSGDTRRSRCLPKPYTGWSINRLYFRCNIFRVCFVCAQTKSCHLHCELWLQIKPLFYWNCWTLFSDILYSETLGELKKKCFDEMIWSLAA